eukprot:UN22039
MWCYASRVENGETMCPTSMVPTLDMSSGNLVCCPSHVADKYTIQLLNSLEDELDDVEEEEVGRGLVRYAAYLHGQYGHYFTEQKQLNKEEEVGILWMPIAIMGAKAVGGYVIGAGVAYGGDYARERYGRRALAQTQCFEPKVEGGKMLCPDYASVGTYALVNKKDVFAVLNTWPTKMTAQVMSDHD